MILDTYGMEIHAVVVLGLCYFNRSDHTVKEQSGTKKCQTNAVTQTKYKRYAIKGVGIIGFTRTDFLNSCSVNWCFL